MTSYGLLRAGLSAAGVDNDPLRVALARANLAGLGLSADIVEADAVTLDLSARRDQRRGHSPGRPPPPVEPQRSWLSDAPEWVSERGEVKEAALWSGRLRSTARCATVLPGPHTLTDGDDPGAAPVREPGCFLYEPDGAVIRAGLVTAVAAQIDGALLDEKIAYLTSDRRVATPFARCYAVLERLPYSEKVLRAHLRARGIGSLTIKTRGVDLEPETLRKRLALRGHEPATLVLTRFAGQAGALLVRPLDQNRADLAPTELPV